MRRKWQIVLGVVLSLLSIGFIYLVGYANSLDTPEKSPWYVAPTIFVGILLGMLSGIGAVAVFTDAYLKRKEKK